MPEEKPPLPPFTEESAREKVQKAQDAWNAHDPELVAQGYIVDSDWRDRHRFFNEIGHPGGGGAELPELANRPPRGRLT